MTAPLKTFLELMLEFSWLWLLHAAYMLRTRARPAAAVVRGVKFILAKSRHPDTVMRDYLICWDIIAAFFFVLLVWSAAIE